MKRYLLNALFAASGVVLAVGTEASAQTDRCSDVLRDGTFQTSTYRENTYFQQIIWSRFVSSTFQQSKSDRALGFGVPVGEIVMGGDYSEAAFNQKKADIRRELSNTLTITNEIDAALASGDATVVGAWSECMKGRGGYISLRIFPVSAKQAFAEIAWVPGLAGTPTGVASTTLDEDVTLPQGITFSSGSSCFKAGKQLISGIPPCRATINLPDAKADLAVAVNAAHGSAYAYLPPRLVLIRETLPYAVRDVDYLQRDAFREDKRVGGSIKLTPQEIADGWRLVPTSASVRVEVISQGHWVHRCDDPKWSADLYSMNYDYHMFASQKNSPERNIKITCRVLPSVNMSRDRWLPIDSVN